MMKFMPDSAPPDAIKRAGGYAGTMKGCRPEGRRPDISMAQIAIAPRLNAKSFHARPPFLYSKRRTWLCPTISPMLDRELKRIAAPAGVEPAPAG